ncbi:DUF3866 family protein [Bowdeniella nasicola]|nr:DUF3866 family protein [Bowdeniella nasicola]
MHWRYGLIMGVSRRWPGVDRFVLDVEGDEVLAIAYRDLVGELKTGQRVMVNVTALRRELGTGGVALIIAPADELPADPPAGPGHIVKARYLPVQQMIEAVEEQDSPHHDTFVDPEPLAETPVVVCDLHSAVPALARGVQLVRPEARIAYVMTDGAALPLAFSLSAAMMAEAGMLCGTITCGQAFGGDLEATSVANGIIAARRVLGADVVIVAQGPGNVGTGTDYGFSGLDTAWHLQQAALVGARPIAVVRASSADARERHFGLSHHSLTVLRDACPIALDIPVPRDVTADSATQRAFAAFGQNLAQLRGRHRVHDVDITGLDEALADSPVALRTMGRSYEEDRLSFLCAGAAGVWAGRQLG